MSDKKESPTKETGNPKKEQPATCGLVMPISALDGCGPDHWADVKSIVTESVESIAHPKFSVRLVSDADEVGIIQKRIVQNLYSSDVVVCDVSGKNPNVMFELGLRLAFDKPTIIIKDDKTDYSFDTSIIEHLSYPRDLRFSKIVAFKTQMAEKIAASYRKAKNDPEHSTFLKSFGKFHVVSLEENAIPADKLVIEMLADLQSEMSMLRRRVSSGSHRIGAPQELSVALVDEIVGKIAEFCKLNSIATDATSLVGRDDLYEYVQDEINARERFVNKRGFQSAVDYILNTRKIL